LTISIYFINSKEVHSSEGWNNHVELGLWADVLIIAPATANTLAKMANGICDNMLLAAYLSARCPVFFAPAMDLDMWEHFTTRSNLETIPVESAQEMFTAATDLFKKADVAILAAAVADYRPAEVSDKKIKKKAGDLSILLERTQDIAATLGASKSKKQITVGFALETNDEKANAKGKLNKKNFNFIVLNSLRDKGAGFRHDTNKITILHTDGKMLEYPLKSKTAVATDIVNELVKII